MPYQVLARKWRPKKFVDVVGQPHITRSLKNALLRKEVGHAYLFTGTRGVGKTSIARIFAKAIQCPNLDSEGNPCLRCQSCQEIDLDHSLDVIEIDGASHNGVDHIRQLVENIQYMPVRGSKRIYIIDEVHMLTKEAFNALLKTLEEPPSHVIFIFATTLPDKLLGTVLSRCQRFDFRNASLENIIEHLKYVTTQEGISFEKPELLRAIAVEAKGSLRDSLSLLDQVLSFSVEKTITEETVVESMGLARTSAIKEILTHLLSGNAYECSHAYREVLRENVELEKLCLSLLDSLYSLIQRRYARQKTPGLSETSEEQVSLELIKGISAAELFWIYETLAKDLQWSLKSLDPEKISEIVLQKVCGRRTFFNEGQLNLNEDHVNEGQTEKTTEAKEKLEVLPKQVITEPLTGPSQSLKPWEEFVHFLFQVAPSLAAKLEHSNLLQPLEAQSGVLEVRLGFKESSKVFLDFFNEREVYEKLISFVGQFYGKESSSIQMKLEAVSFQESAEEKAFKTYAEIERERQEQETRQKREEFLKNNLIKQAEEIFHAKIDRVIINNNFEHS